MSSEEFGVWKYLADKHGFGFEADNWHPGMIAATVGNTGPRPQGSKILKPSDFYPPRRTR